MATALKTVRLIVTTIGESCSVWFEPYGAGTRLDPGKRLTVEVTGPECGVLEVSRTPESIIICAWDGAETRVWDQDGNEIPT